MPKLRFQDVGDDIESQSSSSSSNYSDDSSASGSASDKSSIGSEASSGGWSQFFRDHWMIIGLVILSVIGIFILIWMFTVRPHQENASILAMRNKLIPPNGGPAANQQPASGPQQAAQAQQASQTSQAPQSSLTEAQKREEQARRMKQAEEAAARRAAEIKRREEEIKAREEATKAKITEIYDSSPPPLSEQTVHVPESPPTTSAVVEVEKPAENGNIFADYEQLNLSA